MSFTKSQVNKLGEKLRHGTAIDGESLERLQDLRVLYDAPMARVQVSLRDRLGVDATSRLKTVNTIIEKLRREKIGLPKCRTSPVCASSRRWALAPRTKWSKGSSAYLLGLASLIAVDTRGTVCDPPCFVPIREIRPN